MGSAGFIAGCLIGTSILYSIVMGIIATKTIPTERTDLSESKGVKQ
jgi:hypothetical protein